MEPVGSLHFCILFPMKQIISGYMPPDKPYSKVVNSFLSHCHSANANQLKLTMDWQTVPIQCHCRLYVLEWKSCHLANEEPMLELFTNNLKLIATRLPLYPNLT